MNRYEKLKLANPNLVIYDTHGENFKRYGNLITTDTKDICKMVVGYLKLPSEGSCYVPALDDIDNSQWAEELRRNQCGGLDEQVGVCYGHSNYLNALEWHTCSEFNVAVTDMVLLLAKREDLDKNLQMDSNAVKAFYVHQGDVIEVYSDTLHYCPCEVSRDGFISIVGLQRGTNYPLEDKSMEGLLRATNKWLVAHEENEAQLAKGAISGIYGENIRINRIDE